MKEIKDKLKSVLSEMEKIHNQFSYHKQHNSLYQIWELDSNNKRVKEKTDQYNNLEYAIPKNIDVEIEAKLETLKFHLEDIGAFRLINEIEKQPFVHGRGIDSLVRFFNGVVYTEVNSFIKTGRLSYVEKKNKVANSNKNPKKEVKLNESQKIDLKLLISNDEIYKVIDELLNNLKGNQADKFNQVIQLSFRYKNLKGQINKGLLKDDEMENRLNNISFSLLEIIDNL
jgi:hypothetical protein